MANSFKYQDKQYQVGDSLTINYKIKEGDKFRIQPFKGILIQVKGVAENRSITVRKVSKTGIGVERIIPLNSPFISSIIFEKKGNLQKSKAYFIRNLNESAIRHKLYRKK